MSANLVVDLNQTTVHKPSVSPVGVASTPSSGTIVGEIVDLSDSDTFCNVYAVGGPSSGLAQVQVQTSPDTTSGNFTDPTSGLARFPGPFISGGLFWANSGLWPASGSPASQISGAPLFASGGVQYAAFQRPHRYARVILLSGTFDSLMGAGFISQKMTTGSGGGTTLAPSSGVVSV